MPPVVRRPRTARELLAAVAPFNPGADGLDLTFAADPPADLVPLLGILHTGVRAELTGRRWYGCDGETGRIARLDPAATVPAGISLLCVEGDRAWDWLPESARTAYPALFDPA